MTATLRKSLHKPSGIDIMRISIEQIDTGNAGWSSPVAREAHNLEVVGSNPAPATRIPQLCSNMIVGFFMRGSYVVQLPTEAHWERQCI